MKRIEYKFNGKVVCIVDEMLNNVAVFRLGGQFSKCSIQDAHSLAKAFIEQLKGCSPAPE